MSDSLGPVPVNLGATLFMIHARVRATKILWWWRRKEHIVYVQLVSH
jgi:hypothetical protein